MDTPPGKPTATRPPGRGLRILLILSLGLNILIIGMVAGALLRPEPKERPRVERDVSALGLRSYFNALDPDSRRELRARIRDNRADFTLGPRAYRAHLRALSEAIAAEPFNPAAVEAVLSAQATTVGRNLRAGHRLLLEQLQDMTPEARAEVAKRLLRRRR